MNDNNIIKEKVHCCYCHEDVNKDEIVATDKHGNWCYLCNEYDY